MVVVAAAVLLRRRWHVGTVPDRLCYNFTMIFSHYQIAVQKRSDKSISNLARIPSEVAAASLPIFASLEYWISVQ